MPLATLLDLAYMAAASYGDNVDDVRTRFRDNINDMYWNIVAYQAGTPANGFQGAVFESETEVICAYKGSKGGFRDKTTTGYDDWSVNDVQIALNKIPNQVEAATDFINYARFLAGDKPVALVGHSLGGGLAQYVGYTTKIPFVTFNAPGMRNNLPLRFYKRREDVRGFNMILASDPVGNFGWHLGKTERFRTIAMFNPFGGASTFAHVMKNVIATLQLERNSKWAAKTVNQLV